jgi:hypothetical protein
MLTLAFEPLNLYYIYIYIYRERERERERERDWLHIFDKDIIVEEITKRRALWREIETKVPRF